MNKNQEVHEHGVSHFEPADRVTATELIDGVQHLLVLEQDETGCYREIILEPLKSRDRQVLAEALA